MKPLRGAIAFLAFGALAGCNGLIGVKDIFLGDAGPSADFDASSGIDGASADGGMQDAALTDRAVADVAIDTAPTCTNTTTDSQNCGACGHDCLGGTCAAGKCAPVKVVAAQGRPFAIRVDGTSIYWSDISGSKGIIYKIAKLATLGAPIKLAETADPLVYDLVIDGSHVYFSSGSTGNPGFVERVPLAGGAKQVISAAPDPRGLSIDTSRVYWSNANAPTDVLAATKAADAGSVQLAPLETSPSQTFSDGTHLFWTLETSSGTIRRCTLPGCMDRADMVVNLYDPKALATNATLLFYAVDDGVFQIAKNAPAGAGAAVATAQALPFAIAADDKDVVWVNLGRSGNNFMDGDIRRCPIMAGTAQCNGMGEVLATSTNNPRGIAMDAKAVYWTTQYDGTVWRLAR